MNESAAQKIKNSVKAALSGIGLSHGVEKVKRGKIWLEIERASSASGSQPTKKGLAHSISDIPQSQIEENGYQHYEVRDWRSYCVERLEGKGLEIGPLHRPMVRHDGMKVDYIDRSTVAELREHYPELKDLPLVEPNIIGNAETMENIASDSYDFLIAAHVIEHMKNPIKSLKEWVRVVRPRGLIYLVVPDKRAIFDVARVRTTLEHMILDYLRPSAERDFEHYLDYAIHVHKKKGEAAIANANHLFDTDYSIHFHVFLPSDIKRLVSWFSENIYPVRVVAGPLGAPCSDEFHLLLEKIEFIES